MKTGEILNKKLLPPGRGVGVTCVKFSPCQKYVLTGYGVRETQGREPDGQEDGHEVVSVWEVGAPIRGGESEVTKKKGKMNGKSMKKVMKKMKPVCGLISHVNTIHSSIDDVNIARFHPQVGCGLVYGSKQGRVRVINSLHRVEKIKERLDNSVQSSPSMGDRGRGHR